MRSFFPAVALLIVAAHAHCADLSWPDGTVWHDVAFAGWDTKSVTLKHDGTSTREAIKDLPPDAKWAVFNAMANSLRTSPDDQDDIAALKVKGVRFIGSLRQVLSQHTSLVSGEAEWTYQKKDIWLVGSLPDNAVDDTPLDAWIWPVGPYQYTTALGTPRTILRYATSPELALVLSRSDQPR